MRRERPVRCGETCSDKVDVSTQERATPQDPGTSCQKGVPPALRRPQGTQRAPIASSAQPAQLHHHANYASAPTSSPFAPPCNRHASAGTADRPRPRARRAEVAACRAQDPGTPVPKGGLPRHCAGLRGPARAHLLDVQLQARPLLSQVALHQAPGRSRAARVAGAFVRCSKRTSELPTSLWNIARARSGLEFRYMC
jgi:hypothetical protein